MKNSIMLSAVLVSLVSFVQASSVVDSVSGQVQAAVMQSDKISAESNALLGKLVERMNVLKGQAAALLSQTTNGVVTASSVSKLKLEEAAKVTAAWLKDHPKTVVTGVLVAALVAYLAYELSQEEDIEDEIFNI